MQGIQLTAFACSDVGRVRKNNEDAFLVSDLGTGAKMDIPALSVDVRDRGVLLVVSDGMGGYAAGEVASALVVESLCKSLSDPDADHSSLQRLIDGAVRRANADVHAAAAATERRGMGATLTAVLIHDHDAYIAEVGDSRGYLLRAGRLRQITKDQSFVQMLVDAGVLTPAQAKDFPQKNVILQALGRGENIEVSIGRLSLRRGDRFLLCSDGLSNLVNDEELQVLLGDPDPSKVCERMIHLANERGGDDNLTAIVALVDGQGLPLPGEDESVTQTLQILQEYATPVKSEAAAPSPPPPAPRAAPPTPVTAAPVQPGRTDPPGRAWLVVALVGGLAIAAVLVWRYLL